MNLALIAALVLFVFGTPPQRKPGPGACDHAAPPAGMRWSCAAESPCDCHLVPAGAGDQDRDEGGVRELSGPVAQRVSCRVDYFVVPTYPIAARKAQKQGTVSAMLILTAEGSVQEVRVTSGDPDLAHAASLALQHWRFAPGGRTESIPAYVKFVLSDNPQGSVTGTSLLNLVVTAKAIR